MADLERGDLPLEEALEAFERGMRLSRAAQARLDEAEARVERLLSTKGGNETEPMDVDSGG